MPYNISGMAADIVLYSTKTIDVRVCEPALAKQEETLEKIEQMFTESFLCTVCLRCSISFYQPQNTMVVGYVCSVVSDAL